MQIKKIAIIHDSYTHQGGAEKVLLNLIRIFPQADIYISIIIKVKTPHMTYQK